MINRAIFKNLLKIILCTVTIFTLSSFVPPSTTNYYPYYPVEDYTSTVNNYQLLGVSGYTGDGVYYEDNIRDHASGIWGNEEFYSNADCYEYYLDTDGQWWRYDPEGKRWQKWINLLGWHWSEVFYQDKPSNLSQRMYKDDPTLSLDGSLNLILILSAVVITTGVIKTVVRNKLLNKCQIITR